MRTLRGCRVSRWRPFQTLLQALINHHFCLFHIGITENDVVVFLFLPRVNTLPTSDILHHEDLSGRSSLFLLFVLLHYARLQWEEVPW